MEIFGVGATPQPQKKSEEAKDNQSKGDNKPVSIFDYDGNGVISVAEQKEALSKLLDIVGRWRYCLDNLSADKLVSEFVDKYTKKFKPIAANNDSSISSAEDKMNEILMDAEEKFYIAMDKYQEKERIEKRKIEMKLSEESIVSEEEQQDIPKDF